MGDRFYTEQAKYLKKKPTKDFVEKMTDKPKRRLKADIVAEVQAALPTEVPGLDKLTVDSLEALLVAVTQLSEET